jgi:hypothetical protein
VAAALAGESLTLLPLLVTVVMEPVVTAAGHLHCSPLAAAAVEAAAMLLLLLLLHH